MLQGQKAKALFFFWIGVFGLLLFLSFNKHSKSGLFNYHAVLWADKAGYFVFLPAATYYQFDAKNFPDHIAKKTGDGFALDTASGKVISKYPVGNALMHAPFYAMACLLDYLQGTKQNLGFSKIQHHFVIISFCFYESLALLLLLIMLSRKYPKKRALLMLFFMLFSSNVLWYFTRDVGLSHGYSFFVFSALLFLLGRRKKINFWWLFALVFLAALAVALRPINALALALVLLGFGWSKILLAMAWAKKHFWRFFVLLSFALLPIFLQLVYYLYAYGSWLSYSYGNEGFSFLFSPKFLAVFFALGNGLFPYNSPLLFVVLGFAFFWKKQGKNQWPALALFILTSFIYAAWWSVGLGCGFGHRGFVEFMPVFLFPFASFFDALNRRKQYLFSFFWLFHAIILMKISYAYDGCWHGQSIWDLDAWWQLLLS